MACGKTDEAKQVLQKLADENGTTLPPGDLLPEHTVNFTSVGVGEGVTSIYKGIHFILFQVPRGCISDLFTPKFRVTTGLLGIIW